MNGRRWIPALGMALFAFAGSPAAAQVIGKPMFVVVKFNQGQEPWDLGTRIAAATAMSLLGVSPSTNSAVFTVPNETNLATGEVAGRNQQLVLSSFPGTVMSYNYGRNIVIPADMQQTRPGGYDRNDQNDRRRGPDDRPRRAPDRIRLGDQDRRIVRDWYAQTQSLAARIAVGRVLDQSTRAQGSEPSYELRRNLPLIPGDYRFMVFGSTLVLLDGQNVVTDIVSLDR